MPRENRKRGKKHKAKTTEEAPSYEEPQLDLEPQVGPSWIVAASKEDEDFNPEAPFGYVDTDVKAYFRTVDIQIREWQENRQEPLDDEVTVDPNAEKHMFFVAALSEMRGKEKELATDPDCSIILERMAYSMDDFVRRVFLDSLSGSYAALVKHRFASHVCQTLFTVISETIAREAMGTLALASESAEGELRTATDLVLDICKELLPSINSLLMDPFASHVIRALLGLLCPSLSRTSSDETSPGTARSKKSAHWKSRQGPLMSVFTDKKGKSKEVTARSTLPEFRAMSQKIVEAIRNELGDNEVRALAADKVASPCLLMLLNVEAELEMADEHGSLMDRVTVGAVSASLENRTSIEPSDYLGTLFRDPTSSHLLEIVLSRASDKAFALIWNAYMKGKLPRLSVHPVGNFVVAKALERVDVIQLETTYEELQAVWEKMITTSRTGVLRAAVVRSIALRSLEQNAIEAALSALNIASDEDKKYLVSCMLSLKTLPVYISAIGSQLPAEIMYEKRGKKDNEPSSQSTIQGSLLLQNLLKLSSPHNQPVIDSLATLDSSELLKIAHNATSSRVLDVLLDSETVPIKAKRSFVQSFIGSYHLLVDDRIGSRVGDRCFAFADTYLKEKIARSLIPQEQTLAGSYYGKFFSRNLNLYLLKRRPDEWKTFQSQKKANNNSTITTTLSIVNDASDLPFTEAADSSETKTKKKRKREARVKDEIDELFDSVQNKKKSKSDKIAVTTDSSTAVRVAKEPLASKPTDRGLRDVFDAIRAAPKTDFKGKGRAKHRA
ncbi:armadillo-type protein [Lentinula detonsa]|uniref:Nucleolar protein 9 n=1 Tax=Lentinula detonsa TaxID=2804962 RepID=A0AA38QA11_9AGAR|nr:armadillo-type protein [Lentinula detonsa]